MQETSMKRRREAPLLGEEGTVRPVEAGEGQFAQPAY